MTDEDIDDLISRGQKKTEELNQIMASKTEENLRGFSMEETEYTVYNFEGNYVTNLFENHRDQLN